MALQNSLATLQNRKDQLLRPWNHCRGVRSWYPLRKYRKCLHRIFGPSGILIIVLQNHTCKHTFVAQCFTWPSTHGGVNVKPFDTSAGVALMYVTATARLPFPQLRSAHNNLTTTYTWTIKPFWAKIAHTFGATSCSNMIRRRSPMGPLCSARQQHRNVWHAWLSVASSYEHAVSDGTKEGWLLSICCRPDCIVWESGCTGPYFVTPSVSLLASTCFTVGAVFVWPGLCHMHTHEAVFIPYQKKKAVDRAHLIWQLLPFLNLQEGVVVLRDSDPFA